MKRKIIIVLMVVLTVATMCIPVFADEWGVNYVGDYTGWWEWHDYVDIDSCPVVEITATYYKTTSQNGPYGITRIRFGDSQMKYDYPNGDWDWIFNSYVSKWNKPYKYVYISDTITFGTDFGNWMVANANPIDYVEPCNGSSCPATDANLDGICDDCGVRLMSLTRKPSVPTVDVPNKGWVTLYDGTTYKYHVFYADYTYSLRGSIYGSSYRVDADPAVNVYEYESYDGLNWSEPVSRTGLTSHFPGLASQTILSSSFNWYTEEGDHFFPETLWVEVGKVTQGEMIHLTTETVGMMKILVVCGVGCLALLIGLGLFGKLSLIFRKA